MANFLNVYDPQDKELVLGTRYFFNISYDGAVKKAKELKAQAVHGLNPNDLHPKSPQPCCQCTCHL